MVDALIATMPLKVKCPKQGCVFETQEAEMVDAMKLLEYHVMLDHAQAQAHVGGGNDNRSKAEKVPRPQLKLGIGQDEYLFFKSRWEAYKRSCHLVEIAMIRDQLVSCCDQDLMMDLHRSLGSSIANATEVVIMKEMEKLAVVQQSNLVNIVALMSANQEREEKIRSYAARLRELAGVCKLSVTCSKEDCDESVSYANAMILHAMVKGLFDDATKEEVLSKTPELDLETTITFVEASKRSAGGGGGQAVDGQWD